MVGFGFRKITALWAGGGGGAVGSAHEMEGEGLPPALTPPYCPLLRAQPRGNHCSQKKGLESVYLTQCSGMQLRNRLVFVFQEESSGKTSIGEMYIQRFAWLPAGFH